MAQLNLTYYSGSDAYNDGDIENELIAYFKKYGNKNLDRVFKKDDRWPTLYHLSPLRENVLNWYSFAKGSSALEIGAGFGAVTGVLCDGCDKVTAVELSKRRAEGLYTRHRKRNNLDIMVGNLNDMSFSEPFDYITLIGVLEYAPSFTGGEHPFETFLGNIVPLLKPQGKLLIAIENRFGLKYWCGAEEDHTGKPFSGISGYNGVEFVRTFGKAELNELLVASGLKNNRFFYPYPDYKLPLKVFSDSNLPDAEALADIVDPHPYTSPVIPNEKELIPQLVQNGVFPFFSNSFIVEASR